MSIAPAQEDLALPPLRDDLQILSGTPTAEGVPTWNILDPVRHQYFQIGWAAFQLLSQWHLGSATRLLEVVSCSTTAKVTQRDVMELVQFLYRHNLTRDAPMGGKPRALMPKPNRPSNIGCSNSSIRISSLEFRFSIPIGFCTERYRLWLPFLPKRRWCVLSRWASLVVSGLCVNGNPLQTPSCIFSPRKV